MSDSKPFWHSKTVWVNGIAAAVSLLNAQFGWLGITGEESAAFLAVVNLGLRGVTRGSVTLT